MKKYTPKMLPAAGLLLCLLAFGCEKSKAAATLEFVKDDGSRSPKIEAELAVSPGERSLGLMYRKSLAPQSGMLFIFPREEPRSFWMKNTYLELDLIFLDAELRVVSVIERALPLSEQGQESEKPAKYVLEVAGGSAAKWGIRPGAKLAVEGELPDTLQ